MFTVLLIIIGLFSISPDNHMKGKGCPKCKKEKLSNSIQWNYSSWEKRGKDSKYFENFKVYIVRCFNESEEFYKLGITSKSVETRYANKYTMPYKYEIIQEITDIADNIWELELFFKRYIKQQNIHYLPLTFFNGSLKECFII